jgi:hypothetical protein
MGYAEKCVHLVFADWPLGILLWSWCMFTGFAVWFARLLGRNLSCVFLCGFFLGACDRADCQIFDSTLTVYNESAGNIWTLTLYDSVGHYQSSAINCSGSGCLIGPGGSETFSIEEFASSGGWTFGWVGSSDAPPIFECSAGSNPSTGPQPLTAYVYNSGTSGGSTPGSVSNKFCAQFVNQSGSPVMVGMVNVTQGKVYTLDPCGNNSVLVPAGGSQTLCVLGSPGDVVQTFSQPAQGPLLSTWNGTQPCLPNGFYLGEPQPSATLGPPLSGAAIPWGSDPGSISDTNSIIGSFATNAVIFNPSTNNGPIAFSSTNETQAVQQGSQAIFSELVNVANGQASQTVGTENDLSGVIAAVNSMSSTLSGSLALGNLAISTVAGDVQFASSNMQIFSSNVLGLVGGFSNGVFSGSESNTGVIAQGLSNVVSVVQQGATNDVTTNFPDWSVISNTAAILGMMQWSNQVANALNSTNLLGSNVFSEVLQETNIGGISSAVIGDYDTTVFDYAPLPRGSDITPSGGEIDIAVPSDGVLPSNIILSMGILPIDVTNVIALVNNAIAMILWSYVYYAMWAYGQKCLSDSFFQRQWEGNKTQVLGTNLSMVVGLFTIGVVMPFLWAIPGLYAGQLVGVSNVSSGLTGSLYALATHSPAAGIACALIPIQPICAMCVTWVTWRYLVAFHAMMLARSVIFALVA